MRGFIRNFAGTASLLLASAAAAQGGDTAAERADARLNRLDRPERLEPPALRGEAGKPPFTFTLTAPFTFNSNVENASANTKSAFHANPSARLDWKQQSGTVRFFGRIVADADYYTRYKENDASTLSARFGFRIVKDSLKGVTPYAHYTPVIVYGRSFGDHQLTLHTLAAGVRADFKIGKLAAGADVQVARREATLAAAEQNRVTLALDVGGDIVPDRLSWSVSHTFQGRLYTGGANDGRDDINFLTTAGLTWTIGRATLELGATFERNASNRAGKDYSTFDAGPSLTFAVPFGG